MLCRQRFHAAEKMTPPVSIAFLDTGISPVADFTHPKNRIAAFLDMVNSRTQPYDDNGHGTHVTGSKTILFQRSKTIIRMASPYSDALMGAQFFELCKLATQTYENKKDHSRCSVNHHSYGFAILMGLLRKPTKTKKPIPIRKRLEWAFIVSMVFSA